MVVVEVGVGVVGGIGVDPNVRPELYLGHLDIGFGHALAIPLLHDFGTPFERHQFEGFDVARRAGHGLLRAVGQDDARARRHRHQGGEFGAGQFQILATQGEDVDGIEQCPLIGQGLLPGQQPLGLGGAGRLEGLPHALQQVVDFADQALRPERPPVGIAYILQNVLCHLAPALLGHQHLVGLLLGAEVGNAEVQHAPRQAEVAQIAVAFL